MNTTDRYHVYSGFVLGLYVADLAMRGALGYRADSILEQLGATSRDEVTPSPSAVALIRSFPLSQDDQRFIEQNHPILGKAARVVLEFRGGDADEAGAFVPR